MNAIKYIELYNKIRSYGFSHLQTIRNIIRIRKADKRVKLAIQELLDGKEPSLTVHGVSYDELTTEERMNPIRALLMLDWLIQEPVQAMRYMSYERYTGCPVQLSEEDVLKYGYGTPVTDDDLLMYAEHQDKRYDIEEFDDEIQIDITDLNIEEILCIDEFELSEEELAEVLEGISNGLTDDEIKSFIL